MSKLTQGHIDTLINWMKNNPGKSINVSSTWRNNGYEVLNGYQTMAINKVYKIFKGFGYEVDTKNRCLVSRNIKPEAKPTTKMPNKPLVKHSTEPKAENIITDKGLELLEKAIASKPPKEPKSEKLTYTTDLKPESVQAIAKSLQGMAYTAQLMGKGATVTVRVEMGV